MATRRIDALAAIAERELARLEGRITREVQAIYRQTLDEINTELGRIFERYAQQGVLTRAEMTKYNRLTSLEHTLNTIAGHGTQQTRGAVGRLQREAYNEAYFRYAWAIDQNIGVNLSWGVLRPETIQAAVANPIADISLDRLRQVTRERVRRTVAQGLARGDSFPRMAREMRRGLTLTMNDAMRIARTEGGRAVSLGRQAQQEKAGELGVHVRWFWMATLDERTRISHQQLDGKEKTDQGYWVPSLGRYVEGPHLDPDPAFSINCRCTERPQVGELAPEVRRARGEGLIPYQSYEQWRARQ